MDPVGELQGIQVRAGLGDRVVVLEPDRSDQWCECGGGVAGGVDAVCLAEPCGQVVAVRSGGVEGEEGRSLGCGAGGYLGWALAFNLNTYDRQPRVLPAGNVNSALR